MPSPYLQSKPRTAWEAASDLFAAAHQLRDADMWNRAYRLWVYASAVRAPGVPFTLTTWQPLWLPTCESSPTFGWEPPYSAIAELVGAP